MANSRSTLQSSKVHLTETKLCQRKDFEELKKIPTNKGPTGKNCDTDSCFRVFFVSVSEPIIVVCKFSHIYSQADLFTIKLSLAPCLNSLTIMKVPCLLVIKTDPVRKERTTVSV